MIIYKRYLKKYFGFFTLAIVFLAVESFADLLQPLLIAKLIDQGISGNDLGQVRYYGMQMIGVAIVGLLSALVRNYASTHVSFSFARDLRKGLYDKLLRLSMLQVEELERGSVINRLTFDVSQLQMFVNGTMRIFLKAPMLAVGSFIMVLQLDRRFTLIYLAVIPLVVAIVAVNLKVGYPLFAKMQVQLDKLNKKSMEYLNGIRVVKAFNRTAYEKRAFDEVNQSLKKVSTYTMRVMAVFNPMIMLIINISVVAVLYMSPSWMAGSDFGVGQVVAFVNYMTQLLFAVSIMSRIFNMFIRAKTSNDRITEILESDVPDIESGHSLKAEHMQQGLQVSALSFKYGEGDFALDGITFDLQQGRSLGIIGTTGSGKTTLVNLLTGLLKGTKGGISIGSLELTQERIQGYREQVSYVPQEKILFSDTVRNNLNLGLKAGQDYSNLEEAIAFADAQFVYEMEDGLESILGKGGVNVSGGQKQRLALARALLKNPKLLILDDSTSALDAMTEKKIFEALKNRKRDMSMIVIGQKISTVKMMDQILVLEDGRMAGLGTHDELLKSCQAYKDLYLVQMGGAQGEEGYL